MKGIVIAREAFQYLNLAAELMQAGATIAAQINAAYAERAATGHELTREDVLQRMSQGDAQAALERADLLKAQLAQLASRQTPATG